jgi:hypothetical protein
MGDSFSSSRTNLVRRAGFDTLENSKVSVLCAFYALYAWLWGTQATETEPEGLEVQRLLLGKAGIEVFNGPRGA